ncbi:MAG: DUF4435 domain-containing protein [Pseudomonadota bacterium]
MFEQMTPDTFAAEALFLRTHYPHATIVLVEGDTDLRLFEHLFKIDIDSYINCYGKERALGAIKAIDDANINGVLCIVDADFWRLTGTRPSSHNIVISDFHDFEVMLIDSKSLERILTEEGSREKLKALASAGRTVRELITSACIPLGCLRLFSERNGLNLRFEGLRYRFFGRTLEAIMIKSVVKEVFDLTQIHSGHEEAHDFVTSFDVASIDVRDLVCGHDLSAALGLALQRIIGTRPANNCTPSDIEAKLRIGYSIEDFAQTSMYADIRAWEQQNPPFRCLQ